MDTSRQASAPASAAAHTTARASSRPLCRSAPEPMLCAKAIGQLA
jgi:hypothetical protein